MATTTITRALIELIRLYLKSGSVECRIESGPVWFGDLMLALNKVPELRMLSARNFYDGVDGVEVEIDFTEAIAARQKRLEADGTDPVMAPGRVDDPYFHWSDLYPD